MTATEKEVQEAVDDKLAKTKELEDELQATEDAGQLDEVLTGRKLVNIDGYGKLMFEFPDTGIILEGDRISATYKTSHLRKGDLLTRTQLEAIYQAPIEVEVDGVTIKVGDGQWTAKEKIRMEEELPDDMKQRMEVLDFLRDEIQEVSDKLLPMTKNTKAKKDLEESQQRKQHELTDQMTKILELKKEQLKLQTKYMELFSMSLEEMSNFERVRYYAPKCIKKVNEDGSVGDFLWKSDEELQKTSFAGTRIITLFTLFVSGANISFFEDAPEE